jgi:hypothetical protein
MPFGYYWCVGPVSPLAGCRLLGLHRSRDRLIALAIVVVGTLPWSFELIGDVNGLCPASHRLRRTRGRHWISHYRLAPLDMVEHAMADEGCIRVLGDHEPADFQRTTWTEDRHPRRRSTRRRSLRERRGATSSESEGQIGRHTETDAQTLHHRHAESTSLTRPQTRPFEF